MFLLNKKQNIWQHIVQIIVVLKSNKKKDCQTWKKLKVLPTRKQQSPVTQKPGNSMDYSTRMAYTVFLIQFISNLFGSVTRSSSQTIKRIYPVYTTPESPSDWYHENTRVCGSISIESTGILCCWFCKIPL